MQTIKYLLILLLVSAINSCRIHINDYYSGIVIDELGEPIEEVIIKEAIIGKNAKKVITDKNGFFKMNPSVHVLTSLIVAKEGFISDTIPMFWHQGGETTDYSKIITKDSTKIIIKRINRKSFSKE